MWEGYDDHGGGSRPWLWFGFLAVLVVMSSIFILRPNIGSLPGGETPPSRNTPLVSEVVPPGAGDAFLLASSGEGLWSVTKNGSEYVVSHLDGTGITDWQHIAVWDEPVAVARGQYLAVAEFGGSIIRLYRSGEQLLYTHEVPGELQDVSVAETGEVVVSYRRPAEDTLNIKSYLRQVSLLGNEAWEVELNAIEVIRISQSLDGSVTGVLGFLMEGGTARTVLAAYSRYGARMLLRDFPARPVGLTVRADGEMLAVAAGQQIYVYDRLGGLQWSYDTGTQLRELEYLGRSVSLVWRGERSRLWTFGRQNLVGVLSEAGRQVWQYRTRDEVVALGIAPGTTNLLIYTGKRLHLYSHDGNLRWSIAHDWGGPHVVATTDGKTYMVHSGRDAFLLRSQ